MRNTKQMFQQYIVMLVPKDHNWWAPLKIFADQTSRYCDTLRRLVDSSSADTVNNTDPVASPADQDIL